MIDKNQHCVDEGSGPKLYAFPIRHLVAKKNSVGIWRSKTLPEIPVLGSES